jgi:hypothetical protein
VINTLPKYYGGLQNSFSYDGFQLDIFFQFVKQTGKNPFAFGTSLPGTAKINQPVSIMDRWQKSGDARLIPRYNTNSALVGQWANSLSADASYSDASYIRLKNLAFSYQLSDKWQGKAHLKNCRIYVLGQNLITITNYPGLDPENGGANIVLPPLSVLTVGLQASF